MSGFASWLSGQGGYLNPKLKPFIEVDDNGDRGVIVEDDIEEGQQLMLIPMSCCLHMPTQQEFTTSEVRKQPVQAICTLTLAHRHRILGQCRQSTALQSCI